MDNPSQKIWDRRTCRSAAVSVLVASALALTVCAAKGDLNNPAPVSKATTPVCGGK